MLFSLVPLRDGSFDFNGNGTEITKIDLVKVKLKLFGLGSPVVEVKSDDVRRTFDRDLGELSLASGELVWARFCFHLRPSNEKPTKVTFEIEPPARTDLAQKRYADIIGGYLEEQGVKLS